MTLPRNIAVIGAGIVGLSSALWLQKMGAKVTLIDRNEPGLGTSFGNAGLFADYGRLPVASYAQLRKIPGMLLDKTSPLSLQPRYARHLMPYGWHFIKACTPEKYRQGRDALTSLQTTAPAADETLLSETGAARLVRHDGCLALFSTREGFEAALAGHLRERREQGVKVQVMSAEEVRELEPDLSHFHAGGVLYPETRFTVSPIELSRMYARHFVAQGGKLLLDEVTTVSDMDGKCRVNTAQGSHTFDRVVICAGVAGARLAQQLGVRIPLVSERGYHLVLESDTWHLNRPVGWLDYAVFMTPMDDGIRIAGMAEFAAPDAPQGEKQPEIMLDVAAKMMGRTPSVKSTWVGSRPSTPDSLPVIGRVPGHPNFMLAFGHGHLGLTLAATTGKLVAESIQGTQQDALLAPFSPSRFH
ncbi:MAG: FAD-binding oxidoreductase [Azoarcus sp.]|nr:FAD-binding oxidoreductase [Azoarcus sp.]